MTWHRCNFSDLRHRYRPLLPRPTPLWRSGVWLGFLMLGLSSPLAPVLAETSNFGTLTLSPGFSRAESTSGGTTGGSYSFATIANSDRQGNRCLGFGDTLPDHILVLKQDFPRLSIHINSRGGDTTLLVQGPDAKTIRCSDAAPRHNAVISEPNWPAGTYRIWVGSLQTGDRRDYTLRIRD